MQSSVASHGSILGATLAGKRVVAVGDHGLILLSDDPKQSFRQANKVPVSTLLTAVSFADAKHGWAVGQLGAILATQDGGESWQLQRIETQQDRPLFAVHFFDANHGVAVGLWSLVLCTSDGGKTWVEQVMSPPPGAKKADLNLISLFVDAQQVVYATAERGQVLRSTDMGQHWEYFNTGYQGTLWTGAVLPDGSLMVGGQHGTLLHAQSVTGPWQTLSIGSKSSITTISAEDSEVVVGGLDGLYATSVDGGASFKLKTRPDGLSLTSIVRRSDVPKGHPGASVLFSRHGVVISGQP
jgi:photosystem II stability/assembly factor-like uncharacterized protein